jgi:uncharacterized protein YndB with AHSA1/START domain
LTTPCLARSSHEVKLPVHRESYESFGEVMGFVEDLAAVAERRREAQRVRITSEDADLDVSRIFDAPPPVVWQYYVQPGRRAEWSMDANETSIVFHPNEQGRLGAGASSHCAHAVGGDALREYLDWRPYEYFTSRLTPLAPFLVLNIPFIETFSFNDLGDGRTEFHWTVRCIDRSDATLAEFAAFADAAFGSERNPTPQPPPATSLTAKAFAASAEIFGLADLA